MPDELQQLATRIPAPLLAHLRIYCATTRARQQDVVASALRLYLGLNYPPRAEEDRDGPEG